MALKTETRDIRGKKIRVTQLPFARARRTLVRLTNLLGPVFAELADAAPSLDQLGLGKRIGELFAGLSDEDLEFFADAFGAQSEIQTDKGGWVYLASPESRANAFEGSLLAFFEWLRFAAEVNYADFLSVLADQSAAGPAHQSAPAK